MNGDFTDYVEQNYRDFYQNHPSPDNLTDPSTSIKVEMDSEEVIYGIEHGGGEFIELDRYKNPQIREGYLSTLLSGILEEIKLEEIREEVLEE